MNIEHLKFLAGAAEAVMSRNTAEMRTKGETLALLADMIEAESDKPQPAEPEQEAVTDE